LVFSAHKKLSIKAIPADTATTALFVHPA
jgi:hypothetical protein